MPRLLYTLLFFLLFMLSAVLMVNFSYAFINGGEYLYGAPLIAQSVAPKSSWIGEALLLDSIVWMLVAILTTFLFLNIKRWSSLAQMGSIILYVALLFSLYGIESYKGSFAAGWPWKSLLSNQIITSALLYNTLLALAVGIASYLLMRTLWNSKATLPGLRSLGVTLVIAASVFMPLALLLSESNTLPLEVSIQNTIVLEAGTLKTIAFYITELSSGPAFFLISLVITFSLLRTDPAFALWPMLTAFLLVLSVPEAKEILMRTRPESASFLYTHPLPLAQYALPAGHAATSTIYVALALYFRKHSHFPLIMTLGVVTTLFFGLLRMPLGFHWLGDIVAGWSWGALMFALSGIIIHTIRKVYLHLKTEWKLD